MDQIITAAGEFLKYLQVPWAICGGYALDLFLDRTTRVHGDIDICVFEEDRDKLLQYMLQQNWQVYEFRGQGKVRPLSHTTSSDSGRNLMCLKDDCELVKFYPSEEEGLLYHQFFHTGIKRLNYLEFLFNRTNGYCFVFDEEKGIRRELSKAILQNGAIPYLAPEIALLYKATQTDKEEYRQDFQETFPCMDDEQREWFLESLRVLSPDGHPWNV